MPSDHDIPSLDTGPMLPDVWVQIAKYLSGELTTEEQAAFSLWLSADPGRDAMVAQVRASWRVVVSAPERGDTDVALANVFRRIDEQVPAHVKPQFPSVGDTPGASISVSGSRQLERRAVRRRSLWYGVAGLAAVVCVVATGREVVRYSGPPSSRSVSVSPIGVTLSPRVQGSRVAESYKSSVVESSKPSVIKSRKPNSVAAPLTDVTGASNAIVDNVALGDRAHAALNLPKALSYYKAAIAADAKNADALAKASRTAVVLGEFAGRARDTLYAQGIAYGRRAVALNPQSADAQFALAQALGRSALTIADPDIQERYAEEVSQRAAACLALNPESAECMYVLGELSAEIMRVDTTLRRTVSNAMSAQNPQPPNWGIAEVYLQQAVALRPDYVLYHLDLGRLYADVGSTAQAEAEYKAALWAPTRNYNDAHYRAEAQKRLNKLKK